MAIYYTDRSRPWGTTYGSGVARQTVTLDSGTITVATAMIDNANDETGLFWAPKGFCVTGIAFVVSDLDGGTALVNDVGIDGTENLFLDGITTGQAAGVSTALAATGYLYKFTARTLVKWFVKTAAGTPATGTLKVVMFGFIDEDYSTAALAASV